MRGILPRDKDAMLNALRETRIRMGNKWNEHPIRIGEGEIINRRQHIAVRRNGQSRGGAA